MVAVFRFPGRFPLTKYFNKAGYNCFLLIEESDFSPGDVNKDGTVNIIDALFIHFGNKYWIIDCFFHFIWTFILHFCLINVCMKHVLDDSQLIARFNKEMGGVFTLPDLVNLFGGPVDNRFYRRIHYFANAGILIKYIRGFYITSDCKLDKLSQKYAILLTSALKLFWHRT